MLSYCVTVPIGWWVANYTGWRVTSGTYMFNVLSVQYGLITRGAGDHEGQGGQPRT